MASTAAVQVEVGGFARGHVVARGRVVGEVGVSARELVDDVLFDLALLFLRDHLFEHRIFEQLLLDQFAQFDGRHLQHLDPLAQLRRQHESLRKAGCELNGHTCTDEN
jgi:hypothetical protein